MTDPALHRLVAVLREVTGNTVPPARYPFLAEAAARRVEATGVAGLAAYTRALVSGELAGEWSRLVSLLTVKESYFFRAPQQFRALERRLLPDLLWRRAAERRLRVWSAGCARGEEAASLAMLLAEQPGLAGWDLSILATDLDEEALDGARAGLYGERAVGQVPRELARRYLRPRGRLFELAPELRALIEYRSLNLAQPPYALAEQPFDLVLVRNVLIYFPDALQSRVVAEVQRHLAPHGYLLLGATETLWQIDERLAAVDLGDCFAYRARGAAEPAGDPAGKATWGPRVGREQTACGETAAPPAGTSGGRGGPPARGPAPVQPSSAPERSSLDLAVERVAEGRLVEAEGLAAGAIAAEPSDPAGYALLGLVHDLAGRADEAAAAYRAALYLDPALFQVRVMLGDCFLRLGMRERAAHQFREALAGLAAGRAQTLERLAALPLPDRDRAAQRSRQALQGE